MTVYRKVHRISYSVYFLLILLYQKHTKKARYYLSRDYTNRLKEIEDEMQEEREREKRKEQEKINSRWSFEKG